MPGSRSRRKSYRHRRMRTTTVARRRGRLRGLHEGYQDGYLRGRADMLVKTIRPQIPHRPIHVMYVTSGKGFPYAPIDDALISTLQEIVGKVTVIGPKDAVAASAASLRPDVVIALDGMELPISQLDELRAAGIRTAVWLTDDPYYTDMMSAIVPHYSDVFTLEINSVSYYQSIGCSNVYYLPFAVYPGHFLPMTTPTPGRRDVCFIGSAYWNRVHFFESIMDRMMQYNAYFSGLWWDRLPRFSTYTGKIDLGRWMTPEETADMYNRTKIVINMHRSHDDETVNSNSSQIIASSPNPRTFEIACCGTLQLTDVRSDLASFYIPGVEIETYHSPDELLAKMEHYLHHEEQRREIALRGLERTLREHTYANRMNQLLGTLFGY